MTIGKQLDHELQDRLRVDLDNCHGLLSVKLRYLDFAPVNKLINAVVKLRIYVKKTVK